MDAPASRKGPAAFGGSVWCVGIAQEVVRILREPFSDAGAVTRHEEARQGQLRGGRGEAGRPSPFGFAQGRPRPSPTGRRWRGECGLGGPRGSTSREAAAVHSRRRKPPGQVGPSSSPAPKRAEDGQGAVAPAPPFSSPCSAWGRDDWTLLRPEKGRPGSPAASRVWGWLTRSRISWASPSLTRGPSRVMRHAS